MMYQEGIGEAKLLSKLHFSAFTARLPRACYDRRDQTVTAAIEILDSAKSIIGVIRRGLGSANSPFLLPPNNFGIGPLVGVLGSALVDGGTAEAREFRQTHFRRPDRAYAGRNNLSFEPASLSGRHGIAGTENRDDLALTRVFRLGCQYPNDFHYDVKLFGGAPLQGRISFYCRKTGVQRPQGKYVNIFVDDCIR
jgi:hypothetical protein